MFDAKIIRSFEECRKFIRIDCCHLKDLYKGVLSTTVSIDTNSGIYAYGTCVVECQNIQSWVNF